MEVIKVSFADILKLFTVPSIHQWKVCHLMNKFPESKISPDFKFPLAGQRSPSTLGEPEKVSTFKNS